MWTRVSASSPWVYAVFLLGLGFALPANAAEFYVAPTGDDANPGTEQAPFQSLERAESAASPGDTVFLRGGTYAFSGTTRTVGMSFTKSGEPGRPIRYFAYPDETPVFDLSELTPQERVTGLDVRCDWIHLRGLEVTRVRQLIVGDSWGVRIRGSHNVIERLNVHHCEAPGVFIAQGGDNQVIDTDSHHNYDPLEGGENADGFGCHSTGGDNVFRRCRGYANADDGFDFINSAGTCTVEHSWAFRNGFIPDTQTAAGNGAGFKSGGFGYPPRIPATGVPRHTVRFNVAFENRTQGVYANHHPGGGGIDFVSNTSFNNPVNFDMQADGAASEHLLRNNLSAGSGIALINFSGGSDEYNSWSLPVDVSADDFVSMDVSDATLPRQADGNMPATVFMHLAEGSDLIDRGEDQGLEFYGDAPDLGAFEWRPAGADAGVMDAGLSDGGLTSDAGHPDAWVDAAAPIGATDAGSPSTGSPEEGATDPSTTPTGTGVDAGWTQGDLTPSDDTPAGAAPGFVGGPPAPREGSGGCQLGAAAAGGGPWSLLLLAPWVVRRRRSRGDL